ncbi:DUF6282 family protein [Jiella pacifica]|uniref:Amidohydrolase-related domain-containing protein n=1 Tax=Jiella pacifica TaxID=2696469 RepID=A0A6N9T7D0_9HYPH|nr:DUF6282 family protein [Jiella pacifica]NDW07317.1 hypothetical protein [Jiella pacifica]
MTSTTVETSDARDCIGDGARDEEVAALLNGAVDLHCHSGPAAMPRILDHRDAMQDAEDAGFRALLYKDHFYLGTPHAKLLETIYPDLGVQLFSGLALNNASGGFNPHAVDHAIKMGAKIVWLPTLSAANHIRKAESEAKNFPKTAQKMLDPIPLRALDDAGAVKDEVKQVLDLIAEGDIILAGGHLHVSELFKVFEEAKARGVTKMIVNHPTYVIGCSDEDIRGLVAMGVKMEHSISMFVQGSGNNYDGEFLRHLIDVAGVENTCLCSDLGLRGSPRPIEGYRQIVRMLLDMQFSAKDIRTLIGDNSASLLNLAA